MNKIVALLNQLYRNIFLPLINVSFLETFHSHLPYNSPQQFPVHLEQIWH